MEGCCGPGRRPDGTSHVSSPVKSENAALGCRVKSGWAAIVLLAGSVDSPRLCDSRVIDLSDRRLPETRQPYHAAMGKLETNTRKINRRVRVVRQIARRSIAAVLAGYRQEGHKITRAALVVGSQIDPASITNPHIRAHAFEGQLFRSALEAGLHTQGVQTEVLIERDVYTHAIRQLKRSSDSLLQTIKNLGRCTTGPWRAEQKVGALAAWMALR